MNARESSRFTDGCEYHFLSFRSNQRFWSGCMSCVAPYFANAYVDSNAVRSNAYSDRNGYGSS